MEERKKIWDNLDETDKEFIFKYLKEKLLIEEKDYINFLLPQYETGQFDPYLLKNMEKSVSKIYETIILNKKIAIYADYDCDGVPGAALLSNFFNDIGYKNYITYIPHRHNEGYGLHKDAIDYLISQGVDLIISIDLGITSLLSVDYLNSLGKEIIITDHHLPIETDNGIELPNAYSIINSKIPGCNYLNKDLCGTGTIFKLVQAIIIYLRNLESNDTIKFNKEFINAKLTLPKIGFEKWYLDLVCIATISDMVSLIGENRVFVIYGLMVLRKTKREGLLTLFKNAKTNLKDISYEDISFLIAPRINSASRMDHADIALSMLSDNPKIGIDAAHKLEELNNNRKDSVNTIIKKIYKEIDKRIELNNLNKIIVIGSPDYNPGILGILASKILDKYSISAFVWGKGKDENSFIGSARSNGDIHIVKIMSLLQDKFLHFGGHELAGGFSISFKEIHTLENELFLNMHKVFLEKEKDDNLYLNLKFENINQNFLKILNLISPFGVNNKKPIFKIDNLPKFKVSRFGKNNEHLKILFMHLNGNREAIKFYVDEKEEREILEKLNSNQIFFEIENGYKSNIPRLKIFLQKK